MKKKHPELNFVAITKEVLSISFIEAIKKNSDIVLVMDTFNKHAMPELRRLFITLDEHGVNLPVIIKRNYKDVSEQDFQLGASTETGALLLDGMGDGIWLKPINCSMGPFNCPIMY